LRATFASIAEELVSGGLLKRMMNHATGGDVTLGHYVGKSETQLRAGWQTVADFIETASAKVPQVARVAPAHLAELEGADSSRCHEGESCVESASISELVRPGCHAPSPMTISERV